MGKIKMIISRDVNVSLSWQFTCRRRSGGANGNVEVIGRYGHIREKSCASNHISIIFRECRSDTAIWSHQRENHVLLIISA